MAEYDYEAYEESVDADPIQRGAGFGRAVSILGGLASLALVAGVGVWSYQLMMRDVSGVPVVRALEGPMRIQPEEPGGRPADHQGLAVNNVAAVGAAEGPADRLLLAPKPVDLTEEDKPMAELTEVSNEVTEQNPEDVVSAEVDALVAQLIAEATPIESSTALATEADTLVASVTPAVLTGPGLPSSLRPQLRPTRLDVVPVSLPAGAVREVDPADLPIGTRLAQLGAFETPELARDSWDRLSVQFSDYFGDKSRVVQEASSGGRTFYRLRAAGFDDIADARRFCAMLIAERADCIPVTVR